MIFLTFVIVNIFFTKYEVLYFYFIKNSFNVVIYKKKEIKIKTDLSILSMMGNLKKNMCPTVCGGVTIHKSHSSVGYNVYSLQSK